MTRTRVVEPWLTGPLERFVPETGALLVLLLTPAGQVLAQYGFTRAVDVMAAAVIGGVSLKGGKGSMVGALGGVLLLGAINAALTVALVSPYWYRIVRGMVIFVAVGLDTLKGRLR